MKFNKILKNRAELSALNDIAKNEYRRFYIDSLLPVGSLVTLTKGGPKIYRIKKHFPPGARLKYGKPTKVWETQVSCALFFTTRPASSEKSKGLTSFDPLQLEPINLISMGTLRQKLDSLLRESTNNG